MPTHEFVVGRHGEALVNVLLRYDHLAHDAQHAIETLLNHSGDVSEETWGKGSPFNLQRDLEVRANDKLGGEHNYSDALNDEVAHASRNGTRGISICSAFRDGVNVT